MPEANGRARPGAPEGPEDLEARSWLATVKRTFREFKEDNGTDWAAALTYYAVLSMFPALIALVGLASFWFNFIGINLLVSGLHSYAGI